MISSIGRKKKLVLICIMFFCFLTSFLLSAFLLKENKNSFGQKQMVEVSGPVETEITISAIGDCLLGSDPRFEYVGSFDDIFEKNNRDYGYFFNQVRPVLSSDDYTIANLENTFTENEQKNEKGHQSAAFWFKGNPEYVKMLSQASIEAVNLANNHTLDYRQKGYQDTVKYLQDGGIDCFGYEMVLIKEIKGIRIGLIGLNEMGPLEEYPPYEVLEENIKQQIKKLKEATDLIIVSFHWGEEYKHFPTAAQRNLGKTAVDTGADLILGHHPHVLQGIEEYKGKKIVYSLSNFVFGGNRNPTEQYTIIYQQKFKFVGKTLVDSAVQVIPCSVPWKKGNYQYTPVIAKKEEAKRVLDILRERNVLIKYLENGMPDEEVIQLEKFRSEVYRPNTRQDYPRILRKNEFETGSDRDFVNLKEYASEISFDLQYNTNQNFTGKKLYYQDLPYLRLGTVKKLILANQRLAKQGYCLKVWDAYRPPEIQWFLWNSLPDPKYIANPQLGFSQHSKGTAVDVTLVSLNGKEVEMPSLFDDFSGKAVRPYRDSSQEAKNNADILRKAMEEVGFRAISSEWWHFSDGDISDCGIVDIEKCLSGEKLYWE